MLEAASAFVYALLALFRALQTIPPSVRANGLDLDPERLVATVTARHFSLAR